MRMSVAEKALERYLEPLVIPAGEKVTVIDKRSEDGKLVLEAEKNAQHLAKFEAEKSGDIKAGAEVTITVTPTPYAAKRIAADG